MANNYTQELLAEKLNTSISVVSRWENQQAIPSLGDMVNMAEIFNVNVNEILEIFKPVENHTDNENAALLFLEIFWEIKDAYLFIHFVEVLYSKQCSQGGIICNGDVFLFNKMYITDDQYALILTDNMNNYCAFTCCNILEVCPISEEYGKISFELTVACPIFPVKEQYVSDSFEQKLLLFFNL